MRGEQNYRWRVKHTAKFETIGEMIAHNQMLAAAPELLALVKDMAQYPFGNVAERAKALLAKHNIPELLDGAPVKQKGL